jgi:hypothetical protein
MENKEEKKKSFWKSKMFLFAILPLFVIGSVVAAYFIVSSLTLDVGVGEAFVVEYAILGDGGDYNPGNGIDCTNYAGTWFPGDTSLPPYGNITVGEDRLFCIKITNAAEAAVPYVIEETITHASGDPLKIGNCTTTFMSGPYTGNVPAKIHDGALGQVIVPVLVAPALNAVPVANCQVTIKVGRGTI